MRRTLPPLPLVLACVAMTIFLLTGCFSAEPEPKATPKTGPLTEYMLVLRDATASDETLARAKFAEEQRRIAECMNEEGFEYTPLREPEGGFRAAHSEPVEPAPGTTAFAQGYGYGIVEWPPAPEENERPAAPDPNADYLAQLTDTAREAYDIALYGEISDIFTDEETPPAGCAGAAQQHANADSSPFHQASRDPEFADLMRAVEAFLAQPLEPEALTAINREWQACMEAQGFDTTADPNALMEQLNDEYNELGYPNGEGSDWIDPGDAARRMFQEREIETAVADARCQDRVGYESAVSALLGQAEQQFVDEHRDALDALILRYGVQ